MNSILLSLTSSLFASSSILSRFSDVPIAEGFPQRVGKRDQRLLQHSSELSAAHVLFLLLLCWWLFRIIYNETTKLLRISGDDAAEF